MLKYYPLILLSIFYPFSIFAAEPDTLNIPVDGTIIVDSIEIRGNDITEEYIILREMTITAGDSINNKLIEFNRERIYSLGLFNFVNLHVEQANDINVLVVALEEGWYIWPIPFLNIRETDLSKSTFGLNLLIRNFRGRNETIQASAGFGFDPFFFLSYSNPLITEKSNLWMSVSGAYQKPSNKSPDAARIYGGNFDYKSASGAMVIGKRLNQFNDIFVIIGYGSIEVPSDVLNETMASNSSIDKIVTLGAGYILDSRNLSQFASDGVRISAEYRYKGAGNPDISYNILSMGYRQYKPMFNTFITKWRLGYRHTFGQHVPNYDYSIFGFDTYIRGHRNEVREGHNLIIGSVQVDYPILKEWELSIKLPLLPQSITSTRIGISLNVFVDSGIVYYNGDPIDFNNFDTGWGVGLKFLFLPYNAFRFEYAFNEQGQGEFLFASGFSF